MAGGGEGSGQQNKRSIFRPAPLWGAGTGRGLISQITSLVLGRKFQVGWFKIPSWEGPQLLRLVPEFRFHDRA